MVHALHEAHRVLKPNGKLLDLRPAPMNRRVGILLDGYWSAIATVQELFDDLHAAEAAVAHVIREGLFRVEAKGQFEVSRYIKTVDDFRVWLEEGVTLPEWPSQDWIVERVEQAVAGQNGHAVIVVKELLDTGVLRKTGPRSEQSTIQP